MARIRSLTVAREMIQESRQQRDVRFFAELEAGLEMWPVAMI